MFSTTEPTACCLRGGFGWAFFSFPYQSTITIPSDMCRCHTWRLSLACCTAHLSAEKTHPLPSLPPHPSPRDPQRDRRLFLRSPGWLQWDWLQPEGRWQTKATVWLRLIELQPWNMFGDAVWMSCLHVVWTRAVLWPFVFFFCGAMKL